MPSNHKPRIVVGVDGSPAADAALRVAYEEARARDGELVVVDAWQYPALGPGHENHRREAEQTVAAAIDRLHTSTQVHVPITTKVVGGDPRFVLHNEAEDAALVVVGSRGLGPVSAALLGSVSTYLLHHAPCPVEVVPAADCADVS
jgi:nucleotide-binding universal stress UspA family protein